MGRNAALNQEFVNPQPSVAERAIATIGKEREEMNERTAACTGKSTNEAVNLLKTIERRCRIRVKAVKYFKTGDLVL